MKNSRILLIAMLSLFSSLAPATDGLSWNQLQVNVNNTEIKASDATSSVKDDDIGYGVSGSVAIPRSFYLTGSYETVDLSGIDFTNYSVGIGAFNEVTDDVHLFAELAYVNEEVEVLNISEDDSGYGITLGARGLWTPTFEAEARYRYADLGSDWDAMQTLYVSGMYRVTDQFGVGLNYRRDSLEGFGLDIDRTVVGGFVRASF